MEEKSQRSELLKIIPSNPGLMLWVIERPLTLSLYAKAQKPANSINLNSVFILWLLFALQSITAVSHGPAPLSPESLTTSDQLLNKSFDFTSNIPLEQWNVQRGFSPLKWERRDWNINYLHCCLVHPRVATVRLLGLFKTLSSLGI